MRNQYLPAGLDPEWANKAPKRGRILRVKQGYNPNSSSMGSIVFALPATMLGLTVAFGAVAGFVASVMARKGISTKKQQKEES